MRSPITASDLLLSVTLKGQVHIHPYFKPLYLRKDYKVGAHATIDL